MVSMSNTSFIMLIDRIFTKIHHCPYSLLLLNDFENLLKNLFTKLFQIKLNKTFMICKMWKNVFRMIKFKVKI